MPIHFSIGFVVESSPDMTIDAVCARVAGDVNIKGKWGTNMSCGCGTNNCGCIYRGYLCLPRGDDGRIIISVYDSDDDEFDLTGASEIVFMISEGLNIGGNISPGGIVLLTKKLSEGDISIAGTNYQIVIVLTSAETAALTKSNLYYEAQVTTSAGLKKTVSAGIFKAQNTQIKDIV